jgi:hypothetical protein
MKSIDKYNGAGTLRTLRQYEAMTGALPNGLHTGLDANAASADLMAGTASIVQTNFNSANTVVEELSAGDVAALEAIGITELAYGKGNPNGHEHADLGYVSLTAGAHVITIPKNSPYWGDKTGNAITFNGKGPHYLGHAGYTKIIPLFITPTAEWVREGESWVKGFKVGMDIPATSPLPDSGEFPYYIAYVGIYGAGYTVTSNAPAGVPDVHLHELGTSENHALALLTAELAENYASGSFTAPTVWSGATPKTCTSTFTPSNGVDPDIPVTFTLGYKDESTATLLGTSTPDCVSTNP